MAWIENVFYHNTPSVFINRHSIQTEDLSASKAEWRAEAYKTLTKTDSDHVVYCTVEYDADNVPIEVNFYMEPMSDDDFYERTDAVDREAGRKGHTMFVGAVHRHK